MVAARSAGEQSPVDGFEKQPNYSCVLRVDQLKSDLTILRGCLIMVSYRYGSGTCFKKGKSFR